MRRSPLRAGILPLLLVAALTMLAACGDVTVTPGENAQSLGNAANANLRATSATPAATATRATRARPTATPTGGANRTSNGCAITSQQVQAEQFLLNRLNQHRKDAGVAPLTLSAKISAVSRAHSCDMYRHQKLSHTGSDGSTPTQRIKATGLAAHAWGENIGTAAGYGLTGGIVANDNDMMAEPMECCNHRWNILNASYKLVGIGIIYADGQEWLTEDFAG